MSTNARINAILTRHVAFYKHATDGQSAFIPGRIFASMLDMTDEDAVLEAFNHAVIDEMPSLFAHNNIAPTIENVVRYAFERVGLWDRIYSRPLA